MAELVDLQAVTVRADLGTTLEECVRALAGMLDGAGRLSDLDTFVADVLAREAKGSTTLPGGVALPHARSAGVLEPSVAVASLASPVDTPDGHDFDLVFLLAVPEDQPGEYLQLLRKVTTAVVKPGFRSDCREAVTAEHLAALARTGFAGR